MIRVHLRAEGVSFALVVTDGLPEVVHWGADLGELSQQEFDALALGAAFQVSPNQVDATPRYTLLLEGRYGWLGKPGLIGSRRGRDWTPAWTTTGVLLDGAEAGDYIAPGAGTVEFLAEAEGLALAITVELTAQGLVRARARLTNAQGDPFAVNELTLGLPVPRSAEEMRRSGLVNLHDVLCRRA